MPRNELFDFIEKQSFDFVNELLSKHGNAINSDLAYELVDRWGTFENSSLECRTTAICILFAHIKLESLSGEVLVGKVKVNPCISHNDYVRALETKLRDQPNNSFPIFAVGKLDKTYPNYRLVTDDEINNKSFVSKFIESYNKNYLHALDTYKNDDIICAKNYHLKVDHDKRVRYIRLYQENGKTLIRTIDTDVNTTRFLLPTLSLCESQGIAMSDIRLFVSI